MVAQQQAGLVRPDDPLQLALFIWAAVHGLARLAIDGQLRGANADPDALVRFTIDRIRTGLASA